MGLASTYDPDNGLVDVVRVGQLFYHRFDHAVGDDLSYQEAERLAVELIVRYHQE